MRTVGGESSKCSPGILIFRRTVLGDEKGDLIFKGGVCKKTNTPDWNEKFQLNVHDSEMEIICIRFGSGGKKGLKGKNFMGEIEFPLRSSVRDFDKPNYQFKWYPVKHEGEELGQVKIFIEFVDTKEVGKPKDFQQVSHIGWSADGGFDINNIPPEWKKIFKSVGLRKKDLESNPELAGEVLDIMNKAADDTGGAIDSNTQEPAAPSGGNTSAVDPNAPDPPPPPPPVQVNTNAPAPPPPPPPPGGASGGGGSRGGLLDQIKAGTELSATPENTGSSGGQRGGLLDQIRAGKKLNTVTEDERAPPPPSDGSSLADTLKAAMLNHRGAIEGDDDSSSGDDWSSTD